MKDDQLKFLTVAGKLPARLTSEQTAWLLNCQPHDIPGLVAAKLLKPLGNPPPNSIKFFATADITELMQDRGWLVKLTNHINQHWRIKNASRKSRSPVLPENGFMVRTDLPAFSNN
jgi:hypothetical protein